MAEIPKEGFIKITAPDRAAVNSAQKAALIRRGNQLFNKGDIRMAKKIFLSLGYTDGIIRSGDFYYKKADYWEAYRLYSLAPAPDRIEYFAKRMAKIVHNWINE